VRKSPLHEWAKKNGASSSKPASGIAPPGSRARRNDWRDASIREVLNVRKNAGLCDVSTLGKIEIRRGCRRIPQPRLFNAFLKLPVGKARYGLMLREDGFVYDDGTTSRLAGRISS
jgi:glycine cleavage system aminomethyltransferase T